MERTYTIEEIYKVARSAEHDWDFARETYGRDSKQYDSALSWYTAITYAFFAITGVHYNDYKKEHENEV